MASKHVQFSDDGKTVTISAELLKRLLADPEIADAVAARQAATGETQTEALRYLLALGAETTFAENAPQDGQHRERI